MTDVLLDGVEAVVDNAEIDDLAVVIARDMRDAMRNQPARLPLHAGDAAEHRRVIAVDQKMVDMQALEIDDLRHLALEAVNHSRFALPKAADLHHLGRAAHLPFDVVVKQRIRELIRERNRSEGTTVLLTSHDPTDVEELCSRVVVIHHGGLLLDLPVERMKRGFLNRKTIRLTTTSPLAARELPLPAGATVVREEGRSLIVEADLGRTSVEEVLRGWIGQVGIEDLTIEDPPLEDVMRDLFQKARTERAS